MKALRALSNQDHSETSQLTGFGVAELSEADLVERAGRDPEAFAALYRRHYSAIQRYLRRRLGDAHLVEDATAETFMDALRQIGKYEQRGLPFRSWLYRLATGQAHRHFRRAARLAVAQLESDPASPEPEPVSEQEAARAALLQLPARFQDALALHYIEGLSVAETARTLGCREGTVKSRLARGRERLRRELQRTGDRS